MRNFSIIDSKTFVSGCINDEYPLGSCEYPDEMVPEVSKALSASMEITDDQMALAMHSIAKQGYLGTPDDYDIVPSLTPAESRVVATFWMFYTELSKWYSEKSIKFDGVERRVLFAQSGVRTFIHVNMNTGHRVTWVHIVK